MAVSTIKMDNHIPSWEYVGDVYWWGNSWTCPDDGFIELNVTPSASNWYWYVRDTTAPTGWSHNMMGANQNQQSMTFMVKKGSVLSTATSSGLGTAHAYYYKFV